MIEKILTEYELDKDHCEIIPLGDGLINSTWKIKNGVRQYVLQKVNEQIFKNPDAIADNVNLLSDYLQEHFPSYLFPPYIKTRHNTNGFRTGNEYYRMAAFVDNSFTLNYSTEPEQAYEAAKQFGLFTKNLSGFSVNLLHITLPDFHNLSLRYKQFEEALKNGNPSRMKDSEQIIIKIQHHKNIVDTYTDILKNPAFKKRVTHHDSKISNVLFDQHNKGLCVIDLDTVMPGYFISDIGDMMRTYLSPVSEEEKDFSKIVIRDEFFFAIYRGYMEQMQEELSTEEKAHFIYSGKFMIYMQLLRFLTDHLNNDIYYGAKYEGQNFVRSGNQLVLLEKLIEKEPLLNLMLSQN